MLQRIRYFQAVVRLGSFSLAGEEYHISQSAVSQQIRVLEQELGFALLERRHRTFSLTPAGEYFYRKSLALVADLDQLCAQSSRIANAGRDSITLGFLRSYAGSEFHRALTAFSQLHPALTIDVQYGNHEELYSLLRTGQADLVLNDQRRAFSNEYINFELAVLPSSIEVAPHSLLAQLDRVSIADLRNTPCILAASPEQHDTEREYYRDVVGFRDDFLFVPSLDEARTLVAVERGIMPHEGPLTDPAGLRCVPLYRGGQPVTRRYCAFWKREEPAYAREFAELLRDQFNVTT